MIKDKVQDLPDHPGVYIMKNAKDEIIYVGKAKNIKKRVQSYFSKSQKDPKTKVLVKHIKNIEYIVTQSEMEALLLECNLIKDNQPRYNIELKDNKSYPFIKITVKEPYPRIFKTRKVKKDGSKYFGPYTNVGLIYRNLKLIHQLFPIRSCDFQLPSNKKIDPCLDYHILKCEGCCIDKISVEDYKKYIDEVMLFLSGKYAELINDLTDKMKRASSELKFELAGKVKRQIEAVKEINEKQRVFSLDKKDIDIFGFFRGEDMISLVVMFIREGKLLGKRIFILKKDHLPGIEFTNENVLNEAVKIYYNGEVEIPGELVLPFEIPEVEGIQYLLEKRRGFKVAVTIPKAGKKKDWLDMASQNAQFAYLDEQKLTQKDLVLKNLKEILGMKEEPRRIEGFDIANTDGNFSVAAMISFFNGKADKQNYRHFKIKSVEGPNDYESIKEAVSRRYQKLLAENLSLPDLILIDGGKGQVNGAKEVLNSLELNIPIIGLAKREETIFFPNKSEGILLEKNNDALKLLQEVRNEAHRFGNVLHKKLRAKKMVKSILEDIPGVGKTRRKYLFDHFKSIDAIKKATLEEINDVEKIDKKTAEKIYSFFHQQ